MKYIEVEAEVDNNVKTCSMANKMYLKADNLKRVRNFAPHKVFLESLDKGFPKDYIMFKKSLNPIAKYNDKIRDLTIFPDVINFGDILTNNYYKTKFIILNEYDMSQRVKIRSPLYNKEIFIICE